MSLRLLPAEFNTLLADIGQRILWRRAILCPCRDPHSGAAQPGCPVCHGVGTFWRDGIEAHAGVAGQKVARAWRDFGQYETGDEVLTVPSDSPLYAAGEHDQIIMLNSTTPYAATFTRGAPDERLPPHMIQVEEVVALEADAPVTKAAPRLTAAGGPPDWPATGAPAIGQQYSIRGSRRPAYFVFAQFPQDRAHHGGAALPRRLIARRFDLFGRSMG